MELARRRHAPRRDRAVLDHRVWPPGLAGDDLGGVADDRVRGRPVLYLGAVGLAEAPPSSPGRRGSLRRPDKPTRGHTKPIFPSALSFLEPSRTGSPGCAIR